MTTRLVIQTNPETKEVNAHFLTDPLAGIEDCVVRAGAWQDADVKIYNVEVTGDDEALAILGNREFRATSNNTEGFTTEIAQDTLFDILGTAHTNAIAAGSL